MSQFDTTTEGMQRNTKKVFEQYSVLANAVRARFTSRKDTMALSKSSESNREYEEKTKSRYSTLSNEEGKDVTKTGVTKFANNGSRY